MFRLVSILQSIWWHVTFNAVEKMPRLELRGIKTASVRFPCDHWIHYSTLNFYILYRCIPIDDLLNSANDEPMWYSSHLRRMNNRKTLALKSREIAAVTFQGYLGTYKWCLSLFRWHGSFEAIMHDHTRFQYNESQGVWSVNVYAERLWQIGTLFPLVPGN